MAEEKKARSSKLKVEKDIGEEKKVPVKTRKTVTKKDEKPISETKKKSSTKITSKKTSNAEKNNEKAEKTIKKKTTTTKKAETSKNKKASTTNKEKEEIKNLKPKNIKKQAKKEDERIKQLIAEQLVKIETMKTEQPKEENKETETIKKKGIKKDQIKSKEKYDPEKIAKSIENKKKLPKEEKRKLYKKMVTNILVASAITIYLIFVILGYINIKPEIFVTDLKVFSISLAVVTIIIFEKAYKKDSDMLAIFGIETFVLAIITLISLYVFIIYPARYVLFIGAFSIVIDLYYIFKSIAIYTIGKKQYKNKNISDVKELVEEER